MKLIHSAASLCAAALAAGTVSAQSTMFNLPGNSAGDRYGHPIRAAGDVDGDGIGDLIIGSQAGVLGAGYARVVSGTSGTAIHSLSGGVPGDWFGTAVDGIGDLDGDGRAEFVVGAPLSGPGAAGQATVFDGATGGVLYVLSGDAANDHFGWSVTGLDDVDGDLLPDLAVGAVDDDDGGASSGTVRVFSGATGNTLYTLVGTQTNQLFGYAVSGIGDLTGDGLGELVAGGPHVAGVGNTAAGVARLFDGFTGALLQTWSGFQAGDAFGRAVASAGDVDGDLVVDIIVGAPQPIAGQRGYARVFSGANGSLLYDWAGDSPGDLFGTSVAAAGDVNADLQDDVAVGAPGDDDNGSRSGSVRVLSGQAGLTIFTTYGDASGYELGSSLDGAPDMNGDGLPELISASPGDPGQGPGAGSARVLSTQVLPLCASNHLLSLSAGTGLTLHVDAGSSHAGQTFLVLGSFTGSSPGTPFGSSVLPINRDRYFKRTLKLNPNANIKPPTGTLDGSGRSTTVFTPPGSKKSTWIVGRTFHHALVVLDPAGNTVLASNAWPVTITP